MITDRRTHRPRGKPPATGRYRTRQELCAAVWADYLYTDRSTGEIAKAHKVSNVTVLRIIKHQEGKPAA